MATEITDPTTFNKFNVRKSGLGRVQVSDLHLTALTLPGEELITAVQTELGIEPNPLTEHFADLPNVDALAGDGDYEMPSGVFVHRTDLLEVARYAYAAYLRETGEDGRKAQKLRDILTGTGLSSHWIEAAATALREAGVEAPQ